MATANRLHIWIGQQHAAILGVADQTFTLDYTADWQQSTQAYAFSPHLPLGQSAQGATVKNFFSNLLPEGKPLEALSHAHQVSQYDVFGILRKVGRDCAGALVITDEDTPPPTANVFNEDDYESVTHEDLQQRITESRAQDVPLMFWRGKRRMSLPGVQNKLGVYMDASGGLWLPKDGAPTSHILKVGNDRHPNMVANEYFCMQLAKAIGLTVPDVQYLELPEPVLLVQRYDRQWTADGGLIRIHQIDGCQALNLPPEQKYEEPHYATAPPGATFAQLTQLSRLCNVPASAQVRMLQWLLFNTLIGNSDAHAKNLSFLVDAKGMRVAPLYDLVCGSVYGYNDMAQSVGGETNFAVIGKDEWTQLTKDCGVPFALLQRLGSQLTQRVQSAVDEQQDQIVEKATQTHIEAIRFVCDLARVRSSLLKAQFT
jgi:serine/threonine-protein kinase HipA